MTCIVDAHRYPTKKRFKEMIAQSPGSVWIEDPSIFNPWTKTAVDIVRGEEVVVTNHPKRSWFAQVGRKADGTLYVK